MIRDPNRHPVPPHELRESRIRLLMGPTENRHLLSEWLSNRYVVETPESDPLEGDFDLGILDTKTLDDLRDAIPARQAVAHPVHLPFLLIGADPKLVRNPRVWELVDDVVAPPIEQVVLEGRIESLLRTHALSTDLAATNDRLEQFASVVSHDLRNPLTVAMGRTKLAAEQYGDPGLDVAIDALDRMEDIIGDVLLLARHGSDISTPTPANVGIVAREAWSFVEAPEATFVVDPDLPTVRADVGRLQRLLENLFRNCVDHGPDDVTVTVEPLPDGFAVVDDGPGIPADERDAVFTSGFTTSETGTGLGLDIVGTIATAHGWTLHLAESDTGGVRIEVRDVELLDG